MISLVSIGNQNLTVVGHVRVALLMGKCEQVNEFLILKESHHDCLIGSTVLKNATLDIKGETLKWESQDIRLLSRKQQINGVSLVFLQKSKTLPARSETICFEKVAQTCPEIRACIFEPFSLTDSQSTVHNSQHITLATSVCHRTKENIIPVKILNTGSSPIELAENTKLGLFSKFSWIENPGTVGKTFVGSVGSGSSIVETKPTELPTGVKLASGDPSIPKNETDRVRSLILDYHDIFAVSEKSLTQTGVVEHCIDTGDAQPIKQKSYRHAYSQKPVISEHVNQMLSKNVIEKSNSPWSSPVVLVGKKDGSIRFCIDFRKLNAVTKKDTFPLPRIDETLEVLGNATVFSTLDIFSGFGQVPMKPGDKEKTAFVCSDGLFQFNVMPFGLSNAPATFQRMMEVVLSGLQFERCLVYIDDVIVFGDSYDSHYKNLEAVFQRLRKANLKLKGKKCSFLKKEATYLDHVLTAGGIKPDPSKTDKVQNFPTPKTVTEVKSFLGLTSYYRRFIQNFANMAYPLNRLTKKGAKFEWTRECVDGFEILKAKLCSAPVLRQPNFKHQFVLQTDASNVGIGAVLTQFIDDEEHPVAFASRQLSDAEFKYATIEKEALAIKWGIQYFRPYLYGTSFKVQTDHNPLRWLNNMKDTSQRLGRWALMLQEYDFEIEYRKGSSNANADCMSRMPKETVGAVRISCQTC